MRQVKIVLEQQSKNLWRLVERQINERGELVAQPVRVLRADLKRTDLTRKEIRHG